MFVSKYDEGNSFPNHIWYNALPANIRKLVFHEIKRDGITSLHGIHGWLFHLHYVRVHHRCKNAA